MLPPVLLVDGHNLLYRAWFGFPARIVNRRSGADLTGAFGFAALLRKAHREHAGDHEIIVVFDSERSADDRQQLDRGYKSTRRESDHSPITSYADVRRLLTAAGIRWLECASAEADDVIASLTLIATRRHRLVSILSTDKDFFQLLDHPGVRVLNTQFRHDRRVITESRIVERFGVAPSQWADYRALTGDPADSIPGIRGVGPKTASALLANAADLEALRPTLHLHRRAAVRRSVDQWEDLLRWRTLIRLRADIPLPHAILTGRPTLELVPAAQLVAAIGLW
jgi:DNA polymerase-1